MRTNRIEAFSDGVFAIAITLLALEIKTPEDTDHLVHRLLELWPSYVAYVISFLLVGLIWANHHQMFDHIYRGDRILLFVNTLLLMDVAFLPFVTSVLAAALRTRHDENVAVAFYSLTLVVGGVFFNGLWAWARRGHRLLGESLTPDEARSIGRGYLVGPVVYAAGGVIGWVAPVGGLVVFALLILVYWIPVTALTAAARRSRSDDPRPG